MTEEEERNTAIVLAACAGWDRTRGDPSVWTEETGDEVTLWSIGQGTTGIEFSAPRQGKQAVADYLHQLTASFEVESYRITRTVAQGDTVVAIGSGAWRHRATGKRAQSAVVLVVRLRDGKIVSVEEFYDTAAAIGAATAG